MTPESAADRHVRLPLDLLDKVADGTISRHAAWLYVLLLSHVNYQRDNTNVWPSREDLAGRMGLKKADSVDTYMAELKKAGLVTVTEQRMGRMRARNRYTLHLVCPPRTPETGGTEPPGETGVSAAQYVPPKPGVRTPEQRGPVPPYTGVELDKEQLHKEQQDLSLPDRPVPPTGEDREREDGNQPDDPRHRYITAAGAPTNRAQQVADHLDAAHNIGGIGWYIRAASNGTLPERVTETLACIDSPHTRCACGPVKARNPGRRNLLTNSHAASYEPYRDPRRDHTEEELRKLYSERI